MARPRRRQLIAPHFHVINRSVRRMPLFLRPKDYRAFLEVLQIGFARYQVCPIAYCILSNHWHLVLEPAGTAELIRFMHWVTVTHAIRWHRHHRSVGGGPVYQGRYYSVPIDAADDLMRVCRYVERNAMAARVVKRAQDWPWCSLAARLAARDDLPLKSAPFFSSAAWIDYVNTATPAEKVAALQPLDWRDVEYYPPPPGEAPRVGRVGPTAVENRSDPLGDAPDYPSVTDAAQHVGGRRRRRHQNQTHTHVERPEHLVVRDLPRALQPRKHRRDAPAIAVE